MRVSATDQVKRQDFDKAMTWLHHKTGNINYGARDAKPVKTVKALPATVAANCLDAQELRSIQIILRNFEDLNVLLYNLHRPLSLLDYKHAAELYDYRHVIKSHCSMLARLATV